MSLRALNDRVFVQPDPPPETSSGGIILTDRGKDDIVTIYGSVISIGTKCTQVTVGERVVYNKWHGLDIEYRGGVVRAIREEELLGVDDPDTLALSVLAADVVLDNHIS